MHGTFERSNDEELDRLELKPSASFPQCSTFSDQLEDISHQLPDISPVKKQTSEIGRVGDKIELESLYTDSESECIIESGERLRVWKARLGTITGKRRRESNYDEEGAVSVEETEEATTIRGSPQPSVNSEERNEPELVLVPPATSSESDGTNIADARVQTTPHGVSLPFRKRRKVDK